MGRWEPSIHPCAFYQRFSCTRGRRSAGMRSGCHLDVTPRLKKILALKPRHWLHTECNIELLLPFQSQLFNVFTCGWSRRYWKCPNICTWHLLVICWKLGTETYQPLYCNFHSKFDLHFLTLHIMLDFLVFLQVLYRFWVHVFVLPPSWKWKLSQSFTQSNEPHLEFLMSLMCASWAPVGSQDTARQPA